jgi:hypothetical protein
MRPYRHRSTFISPKLSHLSAQWRRVRNDGSFTNGSVFAEALGNRPPMAVWREGVFGVLDETAVDMTLRLATATTGLYSVMYSTDRNGRASN